MSFPRRRESRNIKNDKNYYTYIMASAKNGTLYIGITSNLADRIDKHKQGMYNGFTKKYLSPKGDKIERLVYYEIYSDAYGAITREKQLKKWNREWKIKLIEKNNPGWKDLYDDLFKNNDKD